MRSVLYILGSLSDEDVEWITGNGIKETVAKGTDVIREGEPLDAIFILLEGTLGVHHKEDSQSFADMHPGELVGELSLLDSRPPSASVTALETATVLRIPRNRLNLKLQSDFAFAARIYRAMGMFLAHRLRQANARQNSGRSREVGMDSSDDIDPDILDASALAGTRFQWMLQKLSKT